ncbi:MAG: SWIM zinc finger family protein [Caldilineales bacterium]|nr:SWIM zinc finger family protein [Caldilineales bacterium]
MSWRNYKPTRPRPREDGIKAHSRRGDFAENWWAQRWIQALERITDAGRLRRGRSYARQGQVLSLEEKGGAILARVQGSRATPYKVTIQMKPLTEAQWRRVTDALAEAALFSAQLLAGEMPHEIEEVFTAAGVSLFPGQSGELTTACTCPDWANPCKHVAAAHYILGEQFDEDPFLIFRLRGRDQEQIIAALRAQRADLSPTQEDAALAEEGEPYAVAEPVLPLEEMLADFWRLQGSLEHFPLSMTAPATPLAVLRRLGQPNFLTSDLEQALAPLYQQATRQALALAFQGDHGEAAEQQEDRASTSATS